jgi:hypothetical protein
MWSCMDGMCCGPIVITILQLPVRELSIVGLPAAIRTWNPMSVTAVWSRIRAMFSIYGYTLHYVEYRRNECTGEEKRWLVTLDAIY